MKPDKKLPEFTWRNFYNLNSLVQDLQFRLDRKLILLCNITKEQLPQIIETFALKGFVAITANSVYYTKEFLELYNEEQIKILEEIQLSKIRLVDLVYIYNSKELTDETEKIIEYAKEIEKEIFYA